VTSPPAARAPSDALVDDLRRLARLHVELASNAALAARLGRLRAFQSARLGATYADLAEQPRYAAAIRFFRHDLYGSGGAGLRGLDFTRAVPAMRRLLPEEMMRLASRAIALNALTHDLDRMLLASLPCGAFTAADYCRAWRRSATPAARRRHIGLTCEVGAGLDRYVHRRVVRASLALMRRPARAAGLGALQEFLERGHAAFHGMGGADEFLTIIRRRESAFHEAIVAGSDAAVVGVGAGRDLPTQ
jgi:hypothetical protein